MPIDYTTEMILALDILNVNGYLWTRVKADNSAPLIREGDMICLKKSGKVLKKGDLVALDYQKLFIVQRIVGIQGDTIYTKADHSEKGPFRQAIGKVAGKVVVIKQEHDLLNIDNPLCDRIHLLITRLSVGRSKTNINTGFFYRKFFHKLRRSILKRLLKLELIIGKRYAKNVDPGLQIP
ncbi:MAG: S24/S26 family peptidase [Bacteroidia bacterium]|nr:S24/S26 family peptidase [Bacteroidia bacterium]